MTIYIQDDILIASLQYRPCEKHRECVHTKHSVYSGVGHVQGTPQAVCVIFQFLPSDRLPEEGGPSPARGLR